MVMVAVLATVQVEHCLVRLDIGTKAEKEHSIVVTKIKNVEPLVTGDIVDGSVGIRPIVDVFVTNIFAVSGGYSRHY